MRTGQAASFEALGAVSVVYDGDVLIVSSKTEIRGVQIMRAESRWQKTLEAHNIHSRQA
jgi:hypothetical protein